MRKILFISGSPRNGNTEYILKKVFDKVVKDKEFVALRELNIAACSGCRSCAKTNTCVLKDDMTILAKKLLDFDTIVIWSPNYFAGVSGILKNFIDRTCMYFHKSWLKGKKVILISTWHSKDSTNAKYIEQGCYGFIKYHKMKLIDSYGFYSEDISFKKDPRTEKKIMKIVDQINK